MTVHPPVRRVTRPAALVALVAVMATLAGCGDKPGGAAQEPAARINKGQVSVQQVEHVLQQQRNLRPEQSEAASRQILERLIDQELAVQKADDLQLERDPKVAMALQAARREVLVRAYLEKIGEAATKPTADEIKAYFEANPQMFAQRRIYSLQEFLIEATPEQVQALRDKLRDLKQVGEFVEYLKAQGLRFAVNQAVRAPEQLPAPVLQQLSRMNDGQAVLTPTGSGVQVMLIAGSRLQPVGEEQARPAIEQLLLAERRRKLQEEDLKAMRSAAKITYEGKFAQPAAATPASNAASAAAPAASR